jgi:hypothetical protein
MCIVSASSPNYLILEKPLRPGEKFSFSRSLGVIVDFLLGSVSELDSMALVPLFHAKKIASAHLFASSKHLA